jgi:tripartite ATP-independent transporter DctP family solute receptor
MNRSIYLTLALLFLCLVGSPASTAMAASDQIIMRWGHSHAVDDPLNLAVIHFKKLMDEMTKGRVKVEPYPASQLGSQPAMCEQLQIGSLEFLNFTAGGLEPFDPSRKAGLLDLPFLVETFEQAWHFHDTQVVRDLVTPLRTNGIRFMYPAILGLRHFTTSVRPITRPEDLRGLKMRITQSEMIKDIINVGFGGSAIAIPWGDTYLALQQKVVDGQENPISVIYTNRIYEVQSYLSIVGHQMNANQLWVSEKKFNSWPPDIQKAVLEAGKIAMETYYLALDEIQKEYLKKLEAMPNFKVNRPDVAPFRKAVEPVYALYEKKHGSIVRDVVKAAEATMQKYPKR